MECDEDRRIGLFFSEGAGPARKQNGKAAILAALQISPSPLHPLNGGEETAIRPPYSPSSFRPSRPSSSHSRQPAPSTTTLPRTLNGVLSPGLRAASTAMSFLSLKYTG